MGMIQVLDTLVANQIAAGEVVERPAAAVKELIENAIDAGATDIRVQTREGGLALIDVQDNGQGLEQDDIEPAFLRHATSKLRSLADLARLSHLGFRGEALPSIAAVSRVTLRTRAANDEAGTEVRLEAGAVRDRQPVGCPQGTRIMVRDLFYNTPARLKFVRSLPTENARVAEVVHRAALARPDIAFRLQIDDRLALSTPGDGLVASVYTAIYGVVIAKQSYAASAQSADYRVTGLVAAPEHARSSRLAMWFAVNGRPIRSLPLGGAVLDGCQTLLPKGRFPVCFLHIDMDAGLVDVNVHPGKLEVRFSEERDVVRMVADSVRHALHANMGTPTITAWGGPSADGRGRAQGSGQGSGSGQGQGSGQGTDRERATAADREESRADAQRYAGLPDEQDGALAREAPGTPDGGSFAGGLAQRGEGLADADKARGATGQWCSGQALRARRPDGDQAEQRQMALDLHRPATRDTPTNADAPDNDRRSLEGKPVLRAVAQALKLVIVAEDGRDLYLIDQHAAHERVLYEKFRKRMNQDRVRAEELLVPITITVRPHQLQELMARVSEAEAVGLAFEPFGEDALKITRAPAIWEGLDIEGLSRDLLFDLIEDRSTTVREQMEDRVIMKACKAAVKANQTLSQPEMDALLDALSTLDNPFTCPHGRPTAVRITREQLEREFKRTL
ncbi:MAG: DNA mismatch repair endonuclease MutL [Bacilli bacterium]